MMKWFENHGSLYALYEFLKYSPKTFSFQDISEKAESHIVEIFSDDRYKNLDSAWQKRFETFNSTMNSRPLILDILITLYQVGIIGVKLTPQDHTIYIHESFSALRESDIILILQNL
jgi:hypothetical protein